MLPFRVIVVLDDTHVDSLVVPFERTPRPGDVIELGDGHLVTVNHVADRPHEGVAGLVLAAPTGTSSRPVER
jgi:hypothetical protein